MIAKTQARPGSPEGAVLFVINLRTITAMPLAGTAPYGIVLPAGRIEEALGRVPAAATQMLALRDYRMASKPDISNPGTTSPSRRPVHGKQGHR